jgi:aspartate/glutamate racemase
MYQESRPELACTELAEVSKAEDNRKIVFDTSASSVQASSGSGV